MTYLERNLRQNEQIVAQAQFSLVPIIPAFIVSLIIIIIGAAAFDGGGAVLVILAGIAYSVIQVLRIKTQVLGLTSKSIIGKTGVVRVNSLDAHLEKIDNISVSESLVGKIFGYATIQVSTTSCRLRFPGVCSAFDFKNVVMEQIDKCEHDRMTEQARLIGGKSPAVAASAPVAGVCSSCGYQNSTSSKFCEGCGKPL